MNGSPYSVHPSLDMMRHWRDELPSKTGRSLEEWVAYTLAEGPGTERERRDWLKSSQGLATFTAAWIAERCGGGGTEEDDPESYLAAAQAWVDAQFAGKRAALRPVYEALLAAGKGLGPDVRVCPGKTIVPFYRNHVFAQVKPASAKRLDLGFALKGVPFEGRLLDTGGLARKDRITHRVALSSLDEIDAEVLGWLRSAYERDA